MSRRISLKRKNNTNKKVLQKKGTSIAKKDKTGTNSKKKGKAGNWEDYYTRKAKKDKYPARSVYKLIEIQQKFTILKKDDRVLDLGCSPGSWLIYTAKTVGSKGLVVGIDLKPVVSRIPSNACTYVGDILNLENSVATSVGNGYDVVLSDMAPATTGRKDIDSYKSFELCKVAYECAVEKLSPGGVFVCKIFQGEQFKEFINSVKIEFSKLKIFKPESCRKSSKEIYIIGIGKK